MTLKMGVALEFSLQLGNGLIMIMYARQMTGVSDRIITE